jgi:hypothetical protein
MLVIRHVVVGAAVLASVLLGSQTPASADTGAPELLTVSVHLTDDVGVWEFGDPSVYFLEPDAWVRLQLGSGTPRDGVWTGGVAVTANWKGAIQPTLVTASDAAGNRLSVDPRTTVATPTVHVTRSNRPVLTMTTTPIPAAPDGQVIRVVRAVNEDTGRPWAGLSVAVAYDNACNEDVVRQSSGRTDRNGVFRSAQPAGYTYDQGSCAWVTADNVPGQPATRISPARVHATYRYEVTAGPERPEAPHGTNVPVTGVLQPFEANKTVELQRLARGGWKTVNRTRTDVNARFSVTATPPGERLYRYRVLAEAAPDRATATSATFTIRGT